jgi:predicted PurR-regulated permease PerM
MGLMVSLVLWWIGMPSPLMWGGIVAVLNYIPYLGPLASVLLLAFGGLMAFPDPWFALLPAVSFAGIHMIEANVITPMLVGRRLTINPLLHLVALSFWAWGVGDDRCPPCRAAADHLEDGARRGRKARHRGLPVRGRNAHRPPP